MVFDPSKHAYASNKINSISATHSSNEGLVCGVIDITGERRGAFKLAVATASKGDRILYHVGEHCAGAHKKDAWAAFEAGSVVLTMRKRDRFLFEYLAIPLVSNPARKHESTYP